MFRSMLAMMVTPQVPLDDTTVACIVILASISCVFHYITLRLLSRVEALEEIAHSKKEATHV